MMKERRIDMIIRRKLFEDTLEVAHNVGYLRGCEKVYAGSSATATAIGLGFAGVKLLVNRVCDHWQAQKVIKEAKESQ